MITVTYTCDRCGVLHDNDNEMIEIVVTYKHRTLRDRSYPNNLAMWCRSCCDQFGFLTGKNMEPQRPTPTPTIEDFLREIIREEIQDDQR